MSRAKNPKDDQDFGYDFIIGLVTNFAVAINAIYSGNLRVV